MIKLEYFAIHNFGFYQGYMHKPCLCIVAQRMQNSLAIDEFKDIARYVLKSYRDEQSRESTGHTFLINDPTFRTAYPNFLQNISGSLGIYSLRIQPTLSISHRGQSYSWLSFFIPQSLCVGVQVGVPWCRCDTQAKLVYVGVRFSGDTKYTLFWSIINKNQLFW